jgi:hypothetical protein
MSVKIGYNTVSNLGIIPLINNYPAYFFLVGCTEFGAAGDFPLTKAIKRADSI